MNLASPESFLGPRQYTEAWNQAEREFLALAYHYGQAEERLRSWEPKLSSALLRFNVAQAVGDADRLSATATNLAGLQAQLIADEQALEAARTKLFALKENLTEGAAT